MRQPDDPPGSHRGLGVKPELVIPFTVTKEQAQQAFDGYFKGKRLLPNIFLHTRNRIAEMRKLLRPLLAVRL